ALFLLVFTPLAYGTVEPWSEAIAELAVLAMAIVWMSRMLRDWEVRVELPPGWLPGFLFLALVLLQALAMPPGLLDLASPWSVGLHRRPGATDGWVPLSLDAHSTWREGLKLLAVGVFFLICYNTYRTSAQVARAIWTMILVGTAISVFGIVQRVTWNGRLYWVGPESPSEAAFGPFVNRAHFAGLAAVIVPIALTLILPGRSPSSRPPLVRGFRAAVRQWNSRETRPGRLAGVSVLLLGTAALVGGSRGGLVALLVALVSMMVLCVGGRSGGQRVAVV